MKWHQFLNLIAADSTFWIPWFLFFTIFHLAMLPCYLTTFHLDLLLHALLSECGLWGLLPQEMCLAAFLPLWLQDAFYKLSPWVFIHSVCNKVTQISSAVFTPPRPPPIFNNSLHSPHVPLCLLSQNNQHFDFFSVFVFPWWREYHLFLWLTSFEWYKLQIDLLIF